MSTAAPSQLDSLNRRLTKVNIQLNELANGKRVNIDRKSLVKQKHSLEARIHALTRNGTAVSDHAIVRYMQRVHGIDLDQIKDEIVGHDHKTLKIPDGHYGVNGHKIRVKGGVVVTVVVRDNEKD